MKNDILTTSEANVLLKLLKEIEDSTNKPVTIDFDKSNKIKFSLVSKERPKEEYFTLHIFKSNKKMDKISFNHIYKDLSVCLFRLDFGGMHKNPETITKEVPEKFESHIGEIIKDAHVHYYIEGYELSWALPINETEFKDYAGILNFEESLQSILDSVRGFINLDTKIYYSAHLPL